MQNHGMGAMPPFEHWVMLAKGLMRPVVLGEDDRPEFWATSYAFDQTCPHAATTRWALDRDDDLTSARRVDVPLGET
jgi:hypothetical protein